MPETPPEKPPLKASVLIALIPKSDRTDKSLEPAACLGVVGMGFVTLALALSVGKVLLRQGGTLWDGGVKFVRSIVGELIRRGWDGVIMGSLLLGLLICLAATIALIIAVVVTLPRSGHRRIEKLDRDMEIEDEHVALLAAHPLDQLGARSRRLKLEIQFYERSATKFGLATGLSAAIAVLTPVVPATWKSAIENFQYYPTALAVGMGLAALILHHRAEILMRAELLVSEARELALVKASPGGAPLAGH
jgi:hypothetical protein